MSIVNTDNYPNAVPVAADFTIFVKDSDGTIKTATMQQYANLFASLASQNLSVTFVDSEVTLSDEQLVVANSGSDFPINLPPNSLNTGRGYRIFNKGAGNVTITPDGSDTIGANPSLVLAQYESAVLYADGLGMWEPFSN